jgi:hypothetical protein
VATRLILFWFCYSKESDGNKVAIAFCVFFCCSEKGNNNFVGNAFFSSFYCNKEGNGNEPLSSSVVLL